jgi:hypothetical protein
VHPASLFLLSTLSATASLLLLSTLSATYHHFVIPISAPMPTMITALTKQTPRKKARPELKFKFSIIGKMRSIAEVLAFDSISQTSMTKAVQIQTV